MYIATMDGLIVEAHLRDHYERFHMGRGYRHQMCSGVCAGTNHICAPLLDVFAREDLEPGIDFLVSMEGYDADSEPEDTDPERMSMGRIWELSPITGRLYEIVRYGF
jgi:hypothetical protein